MKESLALFDQICNSKWFQKTSMILFLNKIDLFQAKLKYSSVSHYFPDFKGNTHPEYRTNGKVMSVIIYRPPASSKRNSSAVIRARKRKFMSTLRTQQVSHCSWDANHSDTTILRNVMDSVQDTIMNNNFRHLLL